MKTNIDLACECGAERVCREDGGDELTEFTDAQLDAFAERIRTAERERCALLAESMQYDVFATPVNVGEAIRQSRP